MWVQRVRARMIQDRREEIEGVAKTIYSERRAQDKHHQSDGIADWVEAENRVIRTTFERQTGCTLSLTASLLVSLSATALASGSTMSLMPCHVKEALAAVVHAL